MCVCMCVCVCTYVRVYVCAWDREVDLLCHHHIHASWKKDEKLWKSSYRNFSNVTCMHNKISAKCLFFRNIANPVACHITNRTCSLQRHVTYTSYLIMFTQMHVMTSGTSTPCIAPKWYLIVARYNTCTHESWHTHTEESHHTYEWETAQNTSWHT